jgi:hypothetical protein
MRGRFTDVRTRVPLRTDDVVEKKDGGPILLTLSLLPAAAFSFFRIPIPRDPLRLDLTRSSTASTHGARSSTRRRAHGRAPPTPSVGERVRPTPPLLHPPPRKLRGQPNLLLPRWRAHAFGAPLLRPSSRRARDRGPHCSQPVPPRGGARPGRSSLRSDARPCGGGAGGAPLQLGAWACQRPPPRGACDVHCKARCDRGRGSSDEETRRVVGFGACCKRVSHVFQMSHSGCCKCFVWMLH